MGQGSARVLFVCLGNICRSPLAEGLFRRLAAEAGVAVQVDSAGTGDWHIGRPPDPRAQAVALRHGLDISDLRGRQVTAEDFTRFDHVVAMDRQNLSDLDGLRPTESRAELSLLLQHAPGAGTLDVPDPYTGDDAGFDTTWRLVELGARGLLARLQTDQSR